MNGEADIAAAARLLGEPARAALVEALMDREPLTASELAASAGIARSTASEHLGQLVEGGFLTAVANGRHRYYRLAGPAVAAAVEALAGIAPRRPVQSLREATKIGLLREARTCYDHLAGRLGVALTQTLEREGVLRRTHDDYAFGNRAAERLGSLGIDIAPLAGERRPLVRGCLDWTEREPHLAGALGAALATRLFELGWIRRFDANRAVTVTDVGHRMFRKELGLIMPPLDA